MPRPRTSPIRNAMLAARIAELGGGYASIAAAINRVGREGGAAVRCTASSLAKWINGVVPARGTLPFAVEAFARLLDRPTLSAADLGWDTPAGAPPDDPWRGDPVTWIATLGRDDMLNRRTALTTGLYSLAAAALPARSSRPPARPGPARSAGPSDVERIRMMGDAFNEMDDRYGGGHGRGVVAAYLTQEVVPLLHGTSGKARPALFTAAAEVTYLLAWMAADDVQPGLSQRYYIQAVRLAEEAGNRDMRSTALRSLAVQAIELGHNAPGLAFAEAAAEGLPPGSPARRRAWITGMCAEALAASGFDRRGARKLLHQAEVDLERADSLPEHEWTGNYRRESYEHQVGLTLAQLGDLSGAEEHYALSVGSRRPVERRTRALIGARLAQVQLRQGRADDAAATVLAHAADVEAVRSQRVQRLLIEIRRGWRMASRDPVVARADHRVAHMLRHGGRPDR
ncbi:MAG: hypothetical protein ACRDRP_18890 [Pseudonocardiaceae bacterium]